MRPDRTGPDQQPGPSMCNNKITLFLFGFSGLLTTTKHNLMYSNGNTTPYQNSVSARPFVFTQLSDVQLRFSSFPQREWPPFFSAVYVF